MRRRIRGAAAVPLHRHSLPQIAVDGALIALAYYLSFQLRFEHGPQGLYATLMDRTIIWVALGGMAVLVANRVYERRWRYSSQRDYLVLLRGVLIVGLLAALAIAVLRPVTVFGTHGQLVGVNLPNGITVLFLLLCAAFLLGARFLARTIHERRPLAALRGARKASRSVLIVGAGDGGRLVLREILRNRELGLLPVGFLDDDRAKHGVRIDGVRVHGDTEAGLPRVLDQTEPDEVIIAIPSAPGSTRARVVRECRTRGIPVRTLPTVFELLRDHGPSATAALHGSGAIARKVREVRVEDVLGRDPVYMELATAGAYLAGEVVLVTGAGGSIGSELCRQIAQVRPRKLILLDHAEDNLFAISRELEHELHVPAPLFEPVLADCKDPARMEDVFAAHAPTIVFHAAAYKHVGLMEANPAEALHNNAIATSIVAALAGSCGASRFVLVSTDKAVSPATVMGASKALAELSLELACLRHPRTRYATVRFGNVLGSSGSVVPIFRRQIERGGPVTVTDERMERYFMTIPEAVQLIIRSGSLTSLSPDGPVSPPLAASLSPDGPVSPPLAVSPSSDGAVRSPLAAFPSPDAVPSPPAASDARRVSAPRTAWSEDIVWSDALPPDGNGAAASSTAELFVLDMGEPVKIIDLARAMIELSGLDLGKDIAIEIVGPRPGEKLSEELFASHEQLLPTQADRIMRVRRRRPPASAVEAVFAEVKSLLRDGDPPVLAARLVDLACAPWQPPPADAPSGRGSAANASHESPLPAVPTSAPQASPAGRRNGVEPVAAPGDPVAAPGDPRQAAHSPSPPATVRLSPP